MAVHKLAALIAPFTIAMTTTTSLRGYITYGHHRDERNNCQGQHHKFTHKFSS
jgi:hypothetical protein